MFFFSNCLSVGKKPRDVIVVVVWRRRKRAKSLGPQKSGSDMGFFSTFVKMILSFFIYGPTIDIPLTYLFSSAY